VRRVHIARPETDAFLANYPDREIPFDRLIAQILRGGRGQADIYPRIGTTMEWDTAAGQAVLTAAEAGHHSRGRAVSLRQTGFKNGDFVARGLQ
jgi:3'(2'), 5'-bisphosphate nucleotidase